MGKYKEIKGDLLSCFDKGEIDVMVHGCNCYNLMGAGIARAIATRYPSALLVDEQYYIPVRSLERLGNMSKAMYKDLESNRIKWIVNLYSQFAPGKDLDYNALELGLRKLNLLFQNERVGLPLIGCGIAGGDWKIVKKIIKRQLKDCNVTIVFSPDNEHLMQK